MPAEERRRWTAQDAHDLTREDRAWPRYEVIDGELLVTPAPRTAHQFVVGELFVTLKNYLRGNATVEAWLSPADIQLEPDTTVQPDVSIAPRVRSKLGWAAIKSLLLAIEVISPASIRNDRLIKRRFYQRRGVSEYWIVDLDSHLVERWRPDDARPEIATDVIDWRAPNADTSMTFDLAPLFAECDEINAVP